MTHPTKLDLPAQIVQEKAFHFVKFQEPQFLSWNELISLQRQDDQSDALSQKLEKLWTTPVISNEAWHAGIKPQGLSNEYLGPFLRVATWNIEKSLTIQEVKQALSSAEEFSKLVDWKKIRRGSKQHEEMMRQRERLASADIILLQEMDLGVSRSGHIDATRELAMALGMNYAYAVQALEIDPKLMGMEPYGMLQNGSQVTLQVNRKLYKGAFGCAVLSKYPILHAECRLLKKQGYDWYSGELISPDLAEQGRRLGSQLIFDQHISRELKVGGRGYFRVDVAVPNIDGGRLTLINNHLEIKANPAARVAQMKEILNEIKDIPHPLIMAGDHNSAPEDLSPTSIPRIAWNQVNNPEALLGTLSSLSEFVGSGAIPLYRERGIVNTVKNFQNPLAFHVPVIFPNPLFELFNEVRNHRFSDGTCFDFRGSKERSINQTSGVLANSNEKRLIGQRTTFRVNRPIGPIGRYRLDWIFVRPGSISHSKHTESWKLAPHFGETLTELDRYLTNRLSDHRPNLVDLPLGEPPLIQPK